MSAMARLPARLLRVHPAVQAALASHKPVVALESTIITHGLPAPQNYDVARQLEDAVRAQGAVPATMALLDGRAHIGLDDADLARLAETGLAATKTSRRDVAAVLAAGRGSVGATTVSGTMVLAHLAGGIHTFGTGGIGGVHRGGQDSMDVSADLTELGRTPIAVFSSGAKSILDIPRTVEYLETMGVAVHSFETEGHFPAFYTSQSGIKVPAVKSVDDAAAIIHASLSIGLQSGMLFGVPIPAEHEASGLQIQEAVEQAVREHIDQGIDRMGKAATPWLLARVKELTSGASVASNTALVMKNVSVAAQTAVRLAALQMQDAKDGGVASETMHSGTRLAAERADIVVIGYAAVDVTSQAAVPRSVITSPSTPHKQVGTTWPGRNAISLGGVGRNMAEAAHRLQGSSTAAVALLISPIGQDALGQILRDGMRAAQMSEAGLIESASEKCRTASVSLQLDEYGDLVTGVADMDESLLHADKVLQILENHKSSKIRAIGFDGNISIETMSALLQSRKLQDVLLYEPTSIARSSKIVDAAARQPPEHRRVDIITPNEIELMAMHEHAARVGLLSINRRALYHESNETAEYPQALLDAAANLAEALQATLLIKSGARGVLCACYSLDKDGRAAVFFTRHAAQPLPAGAINTTGAGDTFAGAVLAGVQAHFATSYSKSDAPGIANLPWASIIDVAQAAARLTLQSEHAVSPELHRLAPRIAALATAS